MGTIEKIKFADESGDTASVLTHVGQLLDESFDRSIKAVMEGAKAFLNGGVFSSKYAAAFWASDLPRRFGAKFGSHPVYGDAFWRNAFEPSVGPAVVESLILACPDGFAGAVRRQRAFENVGLWPRIRPVLIGANLEQFVHDCEEVSALKGRYAEGLRRFDFLRGKISAEALVVHFAAWLEEQYFEEKDDRAFSVSLREHAEVLQEAMKVMRCHPSDSRVQAKSITEVQQLIKTTWDRIRKTSELPPDTSRLFRAIQNFLHADYLVELFCSQGWDIVREPTGTIVQPKSLAHGAAWELPRRKFHAMDTFENWVPTSPEALDFKQRCFSEAPNPESGAVRWHIHTGQYFLLRHCGEAALQAARERLGFDPFDALTVLLCNKGGYEINFVKPRAAAKQAGKSFLVSLGLYATSRDRIVAANGGDSIVRNLPVEPREFSVFIENAAAFPPTAHIPAETLDAIYTHFAQDIHAEEIDLGKTLVLRNQRCDLLLPRLFFGDIKTLLYNEVFSANHREIAKHFEENIGTIFTRQRFSVLVGRKLGRQGEVDVLAYRDNTLFVVEAKTTSTRLLPSQVRPVRDRLNEGASQLDRVLKELPLHWGEISRELHAPEKWDAVSVVTLLVSSSFEFDHLYFGQHLKISFFELERVFLDLPPANYLMNVYDRVTFSTEWVEPTELLAQVVQQPAAAIEKFRLHSVDAPSVDDLIACIEESRFWSLTLGEKFDLTPLRKS